VTRLVAILGYSERGGADHLHPVCAARVSRAAAEAEPDDVVLFSGWARTRAAATEADLMVDSWRTPVRGVFVDRGACSTLGNAIGIARAARELEATEVLLVTSPWHARRAAALVRASLRRSGVRVRVATGTDRPTIRNGAREIAAWTFVPVFALVAARTR
jgi:hypothetical protein